MLHVGTLIPVFIVFFKDILALFQKPFKKMGLLIIATVPAALTGMFLSEYIEGAFYGGDILAACLLAITFLLTATELFFAEYVSKKSAKTLPLSLKSATVMGFAQSIAIVPGLSRSGTVISSGTFVKLERSENASFAFLMSIPVILGAALVSGYKSVKVGIPSLLESMPDCPVKAFIAEELEWRLETIE
jgi:undecaprenyl-diphosphatase